MKNVRSNVLKAIYSFLKSWVTIVESIICICTLGFWMPYTVSFWMTMYFLKLNIKWED